MAAVPGRSSAPSARQAAAVEQFFTVVVAQERLGLPIACVRTVFRAHAIAPAPLAPPWIRGLINLRGYVVTAISLRARLGAPESYEENPLAIGVEIDGDTFALIVDAVGDVMEISTDDSISAPAGMSPMARRLTACVYLTASGILPIIDLHAAVSNTPERTGEN